MSDMDTISEMKARRDELVRCKDVIGWSWLTLGIRLSLNSSQAFNLKACKRGISDTDLDWLRDLADAVAARPRPIDQGGMAGAPRMVKSLSMSTDDLPSEFGGTPQPIVSSGLTPREDHLSMSETVEVLSDVYASLGSSDLSDEGRFGAQWAISDVARQLGVLDQVAARIKAARSIAAAVQPRQEPPQDTMLPRELDRPGGAWERPTAVMGPRVSMD